MILGLEDRNWFSGLDHLQKARKHSRGLGREGVRESEGREEGIKYSIGNGEDAKRETVARALIQETHKLEVEVTICFQQVITKTNTPILSYSQKEVHISQS